MSPDGSTLAVTELDGSVELIDAHDLRLRRRAKVLGHAPLALGFSPDGGTLVVAGQRGQAVLVDAATGRRLHRLRGLEGIDQSQAAAFSPDGRLVAAAEAEGRPVVDAGRVRAGRRRGDGRLLFWNARTGAPAGKGLPTAANDLVFSPDGDLLAAAAGEGGTRVYDVRSRRLVKELNASDYSRSVAFSRDGGVLAVGYYGGTVRLISTKTWKPIGRPLDGHRARVTALEYSPDGRTLATGSSDGTVLLWDPATQRQIGTALTIASDAYVAAAFTPDGSRLIAVPHAGSAVSFDLRAESWKRHACLVAGRALTEREWHDALPDREFRPVCGRGG